MGTPECGVRSVECRVRNGDSGMGGGDCRGGRVGCQVRSGEYGMRNAERPTQSAEGRLGSGGLKFEISDLRSGMRDADARAEAFDFTVGAIGGAGIAGPPALP